MTQGMQFPGPPPKPRRAMPLWAAMVSLLVVALLAAGVGGTVGALVGEGRSTADEESPKVNNKLPSGTPSRGADTIAGVAQRVSPSVVSIQEKGTDPEEGGGNGSGFIIRDDYVVTNNHVAEALDKGGMEAAYSDGKTSDVEVVGDEADADIAVLKLEDPIKAEPLEFGDSKEATVGDQVVAIGSPLGLAGTVTTGIISAVDRPVALGERGQQTKVNALQTDAAINPGNSGGPLVDGDGKVIGVTTGIATLSGGEEGEQGGSIGLGFAIPSKDVKEVVDELIKGD